LKILQPELELRQIGKEIHEVITSYGFSPIRNLSGHGLDEYNIHAKPSVPNYDDGNTTKLENNQLIAIEPFATNGAGVVYESSNANVFVLLDRKPVRMPMIRAVLNEIDNYNQLPFTPRWLEKKFSPAQVRLAMNQLMKMEIIKEYPPLIDKNHGLVSQAEHTIIVKDKPVVITRI
jgi:methionyl aminopeptidase